MNLGPEVVSTFDRYCTVSYGHLSCVNTPADLSRLLNSLSREDRQTLFTLVDLKENGSRLWKSGAEDWYDGLPPLQKNMIKDLYWNGNLTSFDSDSLGTSSQQAAHVDAPSESVLATLHEGGGMEAPPKSVLAELHHSGGDVDVPTAILTHSPQTIPRPGPDMPRPFAVADYNDGDLSDPVDNIGDLSDTLSDNVPDFVDGVIAVANKAAQILL